MKAIEALVSGLRDAAHGEARVSAYSTTDAAVWYSDFLGTFGGTGVIPLDGNGRAVAYVAQLVEVVVVDADGETVATFTSGEDMRSTSFTGVEYESAATGLSSPITALTAFDRWKEVNGSPDWKVRNGGADRSIQSVLGSLDGLVYNVKSPEYGGIGDETTNDYAAIAAAVAAANTAGGGVVFFPEGIYRYENELAIPETVCLLGWSRSTTALRLDKAGNTDSALSFSGNGSNRGLRQFCRGLDIGYQQTNSRVLVTWTNPVDLDIGDCLLGDGDKVAANVVKPESTSADYRLGLKNCVIIAKSGFALSKTTGRGKMEVDYCDFSVAAGYAHNQTLVAGAELAMRNCTFDLSAIGAGSSGNPYVVVDASDGGIVSSCKFEDPDGTFVGVMRCLVAPAAGTDYYLTENGNQFGDLIVDPTIMVPYYNPATKQLYAESHRHRYTETFSEAASVDVYPGYFGHMKLEPTDNIGTQNINLVDNGHLPPEGHEFILELSTLQSGGAMVWSFTGASGFVIGGSGALASLADAKVRILTFESIDHPSGPRLFLKGGFNDIP